MSDTIGFIGLGNMGLPMVGQLLKAGYTVRTYDISEKSLRQAAKIGAYSVNSLSKCVEGSTVIITMLPAGKDVLSVYLGPNGLIENSHPETLLIDSSTIDIDSSLKIGAEATKAGIEMIDAPVTGGVMAARTGNLNFIVGGTKRAFERAKPVLSIMGENLLYAGGQGSGIGVKICNNMALGVSMIAAAEALMLAKRLGLDVARTHKIMSNASGQSWPLSNYCPLPNLVEGVPSNNGYKPGFSADMMQKDLRLAMDAAISVNACTPMGSEALSIFSLFCASGNGSTDYSGISKLVGGDAWDYPYSPEE